MKKVLIVVAIVVVVIVAALAIIPHFLDLNSYRTQIQAKLQQALGRQVDFKDISASFLPPSVKLQNVSISEDPHFGAGPFATVQQLNVSVKLFPLLHKDVEIQSLTLDQPHIQLIRNKQGVWNYASLGKPEAQNPSGQSQPSQPQQKPAPQQQPNAPAKSSESQFSLAHLVIKDGTVKYVDQQANTQATYNDIDVTLNDFAPGKTFDIDAAVHINGKSDQKIEVNGNAGPIPEGNNAALMPFDGTISLSNVSVADVASLAQSSALKGIDGIASGNVKAKNEKGIIASNGTLKLDQAKIHGVDVGYPISLDYKATDDTNSGQISIENGTLHLGSTPVSLSGSMNTKPMPMQINMNLATSNVSIAEIVRLASAFGVGLAPGTTAAGQLTANIHAQGAADRPALNGTLKGSNLQLTAGQMKEPLKIPSLQVQMSPTTIQTNQFTPTAGDATVNVELTLNNYTSDSPQVQFNITGNKLNLNYLQELTSSAPPPQKKAENWSLVPRANAAVTPASSSPGILQRATGNGNISVGTLTYDDLVLTNLQSKVTLDRGTITASPLTANLYGGTETGAITLDTRTNPSTVSMNTNLQHVDANQLLSSVSSVKNMLYGLLAANGNARFQAANANDITRTLNGKLGINLTNGKFTKMDIMNQLASVGKFLNASATQNKGYTAIAALSGTFNVVNGVAQTNDFKAELGGATVAAQGIINLVNNTLDMHANAVLSKQLSGDVGGNNVGGMMQTALANKNGELVLPVLITGSLDSPHVAPDLEAVAKMKMQNMLPSLANPGQLTHGGVQGILGALTGQKSPQQQNANQQQQQQPQQNLGGLLNSVLGGKKKK
ncbi:MAG TPA: AsmA family protein [Terriglobales bacterium]|nr:AsmA family protein [Terriglobales bacterium]